MRKPSIGETLALSAALALTTAACNGDGVDPATEKPIEGITTDDGSLSFDHEMANGIVLRTEYSTDYDIKQWKITEPKTLNFKLSIVPAEGDDSGSDEAQPLVFVEHVHADVSLEATKIGIDGMKQDSMDDSIHGATQPGFLVTESAPYQDVFSVEGYSETLISGWGFATGGSGASGISQERLNEKNLAEAGVVGSEFGFIYDIVATDPETGLYTKIGVVTDQFFVATEAYLDQQAAVTATTLG